MSDLAQMFTSGPLPAPTREPVDAAALKQALGYEESGPGDLRNLFMFDGMRPVGVQALLISRDVGREAERRFGEAGDNEGDAFRHALWAYRMADAFGPASAKRILDGHERKPAASYARSRYDSPSGSLMDLYNNEVGLRLYEEHKAASRTPEDVILEALGQGRLQATPFRLRK